MMAESAKAKAKREIIAAVLHKHDVTEAALLGEGRATKFVRARIDAAFQLRDAGFETRRIADILNRHHSVILYYFGKNRRTDKTDRARLKRRYRLLSDDVRAVVDECAAHESVAPWVVLSKWITERARYEIQLRMRAHT